MDPQWTQLHPSPGLDPGFRWDIDGRARFMHKGFVVDVLVRHAREDEPGYFCDTELSPNDGEMIGTVTLDGVELSSVAQGVDLTEPFQMREALVYILDEAVGDARLQVERLTKCISRVDSKQKG